MEFLVLDDLDRAEAVHQGGDLGVRRVQVGLLPGVREHGHVLCGAEPEGGRLGCVDGDGRTDHDRGHGHDDKEQDEQLLAPLTPKEAPGPTHHGPAGRDAASGRIGHGPGGRPFEDADAHWFGMLASIASGLSTGCVWSTILPSRRKITRSAHEASWASWVTTTAAIPR